MPNATVERVFCTTREAATLLGVATSTVQLWVESGMLQAWKTSGGHRRVLRDSVDSLLHRESQRVSGPGAVPKRSDAGPLRVLVVDDDRALLRLYGAKLARWPFPTDVQTVDNGISALVMMGRSPPDMLIADLHMPGMDGFNMLRVLRRTPEIAATNIVVVSGLDAQEIAQRGDIPSDIEVLGKPVPFDRLLELASAIAARRLGARRVGGL